jgi:hypothetical protein
LKSSLQKFYGRHPDFVAVNKVYLCYTDDYAFVFRIP